MDYVSPEVEAHEAASAIESAGMSRGRSERGRNVHS